jgi:hypothetical protein
MSLLLRIVTKPKWAMPAWAEPQDLPADLLTDLRTNNNELSVWSIELDRSNLNSVLVAAASCRERLDKLDYALFDEQVLRALVIRCIKSEGATAHITANGAMHRDLTELTVEKIVSLAQVMMPLERVRVTETQIKFLLLQALQSGALDRGRMAPKLLADLEPQVL